MGDVLSLRYVLDKNRTNKRERERLRCWERERDK